MPQNDLAVNRIFSAESILADASDSSDEIDLKYVAQAGFFSLHIKTTGPGTLKLQYTGSNGGSGSAFVTPSGAEDIKTAHTAGEAIYSFKPVPVRKMKIKYTETGSDTVTIVFADLLVQ